MDTPPHNLLLAPCRPLKVPFFLTKENQTLNKSKSPKVNTSALDIISSRILKGQNAKSSEIFLEFGFSF